MVKIVWNRTNEHNHLNTNFYLKNLQLVLKKFKNTLLVVEYYIQYSSLKYIILNNYIGIKKIDQFHDYLHNKRKYPITTARNIIQNGFMKMALQYI